MNEYPKWVQRTPDIGPVLCRNAKEEQKLLEDWDEEQLVKAEEATAEAQANAAEAREVASVTLGQTQGLGKRK